MVKLDNARLVKDMMDHNILLHTMAVRDRLQAPTAGLVYNNNNNNNWCLFN